MNEFPHTTITSTAQIKEMAVGLIEAAEADEHDLFTGARENGPLMRDDFYNSSAALGVVVLALAERIEALEARVELGQSVPQANPAPTEEELSAEQERQVEEFFKSLFGDDIEVVHLKG